MATISKTLSAKKDKLGYSQLMFRVSVKRGFVFRTKTPLSIPYNRWNSKKGEIDTSKAKPVERQELAELKRKYGYLESLITYICNNWEAEEITKQMLEDTIKVYHNSNIDLATITRKDIERKLATKDDASDRLTFYDVAELFVEDKSRDYAEGLKRGFRSFFRTIARYEMYRQTISKEKGFKFEFGKVDKTDIEDLFDYIRNEHQLYKENPKAFAQILQCYPSNMNPHNKKATIEERGINTMVRFHKWLRNFWQWAVEHGYSEINPVGKIDIGTERYNPKPYALTFEQLRTITEFDFSYNKHLETQRDIFVFHCWTGARVGDLINFNSDMIKRNILCYCPQKTIKRQVEARVPLSEIAKNLMEKYRGVDKYGRLFPFISAQRYCDAIKDILTECGITEKVLVNNPINNKPVYKPINEVANSHLARRVFSSNGSEYTNNKDVVECMLGHTLSGVEYRYKHITDSQREKAIADMERAYNNNGDWKSIGAENAVIDKLLQSFTMEEITNLISERSKAI